MSVLKSLDPVKYKTAKGYSWGLVTIISILRKVKQSGSFPIPKYFLVPFANVSYKYPSFSKKSINFLYKAGVPFKRISMSPLSLALLR